MNGDSEVSLHADGEEQQGNAFQRFLRQLAPGDIGEISLVVGIDPNRSKLCGSR